MKKIYSLFIIFLLLIFISGCGYSYFLTDETTDIDFVSDNTGTVSEPGTDFSLDDSDTESTLSTGIADTTSTDSTGADSDMGSLPVVPIEPEERRVSFLAAGDNIIYNGQLREAKANAQAAGGTAAYDFSSMYANVKDIISSYDVSFVNQETLMAGAKFGYSQYPEFNSPQELAYDLRSVGFDIVNMATNHMLDMYDKGLVSSIAFLKGVEGMLMVGGYEDEEDFYDIRVIERNDIKIAVVGLTYGTNGKRTASSSYIPYIYEKNLLTYAKDETPVESDRITRWIEKARTCADVVVVSVHWGEEYSQTPTAEQRRLAQLISDCGAHVILGHHTHSLQPVEWIEGKSGNRTLCFYSLGNFTSETDETVSLVGGMGTFDIVMNEEMGVRIEDVTLIPTVMDYRNSFNKNTVYLLEDYTDDLCAGHNIVSYFKKKLTMSMLTQYVKNAVSDEFLSQSYLEFVSS